MASKIAKPKNELAAYGVTDGSIVELAEKKVEGSKLKIMLQKAPCTTPDQYRFLSERLTSCIDIKEGLDNQRTAITKPLNAAKRGVDALFSPIKLFEECEEIIREKLRQYDIAAKNAELALLAVAEAASAKGDIEGATLAIERLPEVVEASGNTSRATWKVKRVDLSKVPLGFLTLNEAAVKAFVDAHDKTGATDAPTLAGVEFEVDVVIRKRSQR